LTADSHRYLLSRLDAFATRRPKIRGAHPAVLDVAVDRGDDGDAVGIIHLAC